MNLTVSTPPPTCPKQKYRYSLALCPVSSAITRIGSAKAYCAIANGMPCLAWFSASFCSSHSKLGFSMHRVYAQYGRTAIRTYGVLDAALLLEFTRLRKRAQPPVAARVQRWLGSPPHSERGDLAHSATLNLATMSEYAALPSAPSAAVSKGRPGLSFTWRMRLPEPSSRAVGSGNSTP